MVALQLFLRGQSLDFYQKIDQKKFSQLWNFNEFHGSNWTPTFLFEATNSIPTHSISVVSVCIIWYLLFGGGSLLFFCSHSLKDQKMSLNIFLHFKTRIVSPGLPKNLAFSKTKSVGSNRSRNPLQTNETNKLPVEGWFVSRRKSFHTSQNSLSKNRKSASPGSYFPKFTHYSYSTISILSLLHYFFIFWTNDFDWGPFFDFVKNSWFYIEINNSKFIITSYHIIHHF